MAHLFYTVSAGTTGRPIFLNTSDNQSYPHVDLVNQGATAIMIKGSSLSSGSSESSGFAILSSHSYGMVLSPGENVHVYTTNATCNVAVHVWGEVAATEPDHTAS